MSNAIRHFREKAGFSRPQLAKKLGTSVSQIVKLERGERRLTQDWMERLGEALEVPATSFMSDHPGVPLIGQVFANGEVKLRGEDEPEMVSRDRQLGPVQSFVEVADDGFGPLIPAGSALYISFIEVEPLQRAHYIGTPCAVWAADGRMMIGQLIHGAAPDRIGLLLPNSRVLHDIEAETICPLTGVGPGHGQTGAYPIPAER